MNILTSLTQQGFFMFRGTVNTWQGSFVSRDPNTQISPKVLIRKSPTTQNSINNLDELRNQLEYFRELPQGWDGYSAKPIPNLVINNSLSLLASIDFTLPEIYPTGRESIQFEFDFDDNSLEIEIFNESFEISHFNDAELVSDESYNISEKCKLNESIRNFYE